MIAQHLGKRIHRNDGVVGSRGSRCRVRGGNGRAAHRLRGGKPALRLFTEKLIEHAVIGTAVGIPASGVAQRQHVERMKGDYGVEAVVIPSGGVDRLRAAHFFGRLAHEAQGSFESVLLHGRLGGKNPGQGADPQSGMGIGVAAGEARQPIARRSIGGSLLAVARHRIIFGVGHDAWPPAVAPGGGKGGGHAARTLLDVKAFLPQLRHIPFSGAVFAPGRLAKAPDVGIPGRPIVAAVINPAVGGSLGGREGNGHGEHLLVAGANAGNWPFLPRPVCR